ncbi:EcsC family protein [Marinovum sp. 2_MG-2023]|uniref:EcsC family protein n=1 Tax=Roseobacteraceae TaxID=2854170 RepID=UPI001FD55B31|nr:MULTISPECIES: EcsC family protein [Roseobacteraceae]MCJ7871826.1 EcsC family protein [Phaeobacter sp. J2-8]MDO6728679.1 EcsC family protein [Marinovum sp. 2_MG-2023]MDO6777905.1 EcsC family protein [Marinovum sp. 1_MG-2023]
MTGTELISPNTALELDVLVQRYRRAGGVGIQVLNLMGTQAENLLEHLPDGVKNRLETATERALAIAMDAASQSRGRVGDAPGWLNRAVTTAMGAAGGFGGLPSALAELPVTTTVLLRAIQGIAAEHGFDPEDAEIRAECLAVFAAAGPLEHDDGANMAFLSARVTLTGATVNAMIARIAPRLATVLGQKLAAQAVPVVGAVAGAATNFAYTSYYQEIAHVHFALLRLARAEGIPREALVNDLRLRLAITTR